MRRKCFFVLLVAALFAVPGRANCADSGQLNLDEQTLAVYVKQLQGKADTFAKNRTEIAKARERDIEKIQEDTADLLGRAAQSHHAWKIAKDKRMELFVELREIAEVNRQRMSSTESEREKGRQAIEASTGRVNANLERLGAAAKSLATLGDGHSREEQLQFLAAYLEEVNTKVDALSSQSNTDKDEATKQSKAIVGTAMTEMETTKAIADNNK